MILKGIPLYGHFAGNETSISQRNLTNTNNETIIRGGDTYIYYLITASGLNQITDLDGFTITGNSTLVWIENAKLNVKNCLFSGSSNNNGIHSYKSYFTISDCVIKNLLSDYGYGIYVEDSNFIITGCDIRNNNNGIYVQSSLADSRITNSILHNNIYAGIYVHAANSLLIANNWIYQNYNGIETTPSVTLQNDTIVSNEYCGVSDVAAPVIRNCIIWNNFCDLYWTGRSNWYHPTYSCFTYYDDTISGTGNIYGEANDPNFVSADSNNFHLNQNSPCIDTGDPNGNYDNQTDIDGEPRISNGMVDMGADEKFIPKVDYDHNNIVNFNDYAIWVNYWLTNDPNGCLDDDNDVDINDLAVFCDDWLWIAPWSPLYQSLGLGDMDMMSESSSESFVLSEEMLSETVMEEPSESNDQPMSAEQIQALIDWTEQLWESNPELIEMAGQNGYDLIMESLTEQLDE
jgi:parallel beta-helix repeat protein